MFNKVFLIGRLGRDPELRYLSSGNPVCNFTVATSLYWKDSSGNKKEKTEWHRVVAFGRLAGICNDKLEKGSLVFISGRLQTRSWEGNDGNQQQTTEIIAKEMKALEYRKKAESYNQPDDDDLPF